MRLAACIALALLLGLPGTAVPQALEHEVKAAFLFKFLSFVEWPAGAFVAAESPVVIGVLGAEDVLHELRAIVPGRKVQGRPVGVFRVRPGESLSGLHVLFVGRNASGALGRLDARRGVLLVSESPGALDEGAVINFVLAEGRVRFEVSLDAAERRGLTLSSRMLAVASHVRGKL